MTGSTEADPQSFITWSGYPGKSSSTLPRNHYRFSCEVVPFASYLLGRAQALTKQRQDAEDLVQDTMIKAYMSLETFDEGSDMKPWLSRIMVNTWVDSFRRSQRRPDELLTGDIADPESSREVILSRHTSESAELEVLVKMPGAAQTALGSLPDDVRATVYFADVAGYRNTEIAAMLGVPVGTVGSRLHRGRSRLRELLLDKCA